jgi:hypothetical protein
MAELNHRSRVSSRAMLRRIAAFALVAATLVVVGEAAGRPQAVPRHYTFSFTVNLAPYYAEKAPKTKVTGSGSGSFSIRNRQQDRDKTFFWDIYDAKGSFSLTQGGKVLARGTVTGGHFAIEGNVASLTRTASFDVKLAASRFHCPKPEANLNVSDHRMPTKGDTEGVGFFACQAKMNWNGRAPVLVVKIAPTS